MRKKITCRYCDGKGYRISKKGVRSTRFERDEFLTKFPEEAADAFAESIFNQGAPHAMIRYHLRPRVRRFLEKFRKRFGYSKFTGSWDLWWRLRWNYKELIDNVPSYKKYHKERLNPIINKAKEKL